MTSVVDPQLTKALRRAAVRATRAPSVHNTQPWRLVLTADSLEIHADRSRHLRVLDPRGRQLLLSCGCAVFNARAAMAASGVGTRVERLVDPNRPDLLARIVIDTSRRPDDAIARLDSAIGQPETDRRRFAAETVPDEVVTALILAANIEGADAFAITRPADRETVAVLSREADQSENTDPAYRAELRAWTNDDPNRGDVDQTSANPRHCLLLLGSREDTTLAWLRAGEALGRMLLEAASRGFDASPLTQVVEVARTNALLRRQLQLTMHPQVLLRVGRAQVTSATRRRRLVDVISQGE